LCLLGPVVNNSVELADPLLQLSNLSPGDLIVRLDCLLPAFGHAPSPPEDQAGRNTMTAGRAGIDMPGCLGQDRQSDPPTSVVSVGPGTPFGMRAVA